MNQLLEDSESESTGCGLPSELEDGGESEVLALEICDVNMRDLANKVLSVSLDGIEYPSLTDAPSGFETSTFIEANLRPAGFPRVLSLMQVLEDSDGESTWCGPPSELEDTGRSESLALEIWDSSARDLAHDVLSMSAAKLEAEKLDWDHGPKPPPTPPPRSSPCTQPLPSADKPMVPLTPPPTKRFPPTCHLPPPDDWDPWRISSDGKEWGIDRCQAWCKSTLTCSSDGKGMETDRGSSWCQLDSWANWGRPASVDKEVDPWFASKIADPWSIARGKTERIQNAMDSAFAKRADPLYGSGRDPWEASWKTHSGTSWCKLDSWAHWGARPESVDKKADPWFASKDADPWSVACGKSERIKNAMDSAFAKREDPLYGSGRDPWEQACWKMHSSKSWHKLDRADASIANKNDPWFASRDEDPWSITRYQDSPGRKVERGQNMMDGTFAKCEDPLFGRGRDPWEAGRQKHEATWRIRLHRRP